MATNDILGLGKAFYTDLLSKVPETDRAAVEAVFSKPEAQAAIELLGQGAKRQSEFSRAMDDVAKEKARVEAWHGDLTKWYDENKPLVEAGKQALARGNGNGNGNPDLDAGNPAPDLPKDLVRMGDLDKHLSEREKGYAAFVSASNTLSLKHYQEFGEILDMNELLSDPRIEKQGLLGVYQTKFADRYADKAKKAEDARVEAAVQTRLAEERKKFSSRPPYPVSPNDVSPLDALEQKQAAGLDVQSLVDEYEQLVAKKIGASV